MNTSVQTATASVPAIEPLPPFTANEIQWSMPEFRKGVECGLATFRKHKSYASFSFRYLRYWYSVCVLRALVSKAGDREITIADMGIGDGMAPIFATKALPGCRWIGLDFNPSRIAKSTGRYDRLLECDFNKRLPLENDSLDAVNFLHVLEHVADEHFTMKEIRRVLRPGGILVAATPVLPWPIALIRQRQFEREFASGKRRPGKHIRVFWPRRWRETLDQAGFELIDHRGGYLLRSARNPLENYGWWARFNVAFGRAFKSFGNEILVAARKKAMQLFLPCMTASQAALAAGF